MRKKPVLVVAGATASGKTALGIALCRRYHGEVLSADSMQVYRGMEIATAAPTPEELALVPHHLVGFLSPGEEFSVADWVEKARGLIQRLHAESVLPVVVGGTGLYISALLDNLQFDGFSGDPALREELQRQARDDGPQTLYEELRRVDPALAEKLHPHNMGRIIRALEVWRATGIPMSEHQRLAREKGGCYDACLLALGYEDRARMWQRIDMRVERMLDAGLVDEARRFYAQYPSKTAAAAIGYKELVPYLEGRATLGESVALIKLRTRQYAKRQLTWLRRDPRCRWLYVDRYSTPQLLERDASLALEQSGILLNPSG